MPVYFRAVHRFANQSSVNILAQRWIVLESGGHKIVLVFSFVLVFIRLMHNFDNRFIFNMPPIYCFNRVPLYYNV
jgi:hypothetical protein